VRVSILDGVRAAGGSARIRSAPGHGTTVELQWQPPENNTPTQNAGRPSRITLVPQLQLLRILAAVIVFAILTAITESALSSRALGPLIAAGIGLALLPALVRGAKTGAMSRRTAWSIGLAGILLCCTATIGLDPKTVDCVSIYWYTCGVLAGAVIVWTTGHRTPPIVALAFQLAQITLWAGPTGAIRLGLAAEIVLVIAGLMMRRAIHRVSAAADLATTAHNALALELAALNAFRRERQQRLSLAQTSAAPMLRRIAASRGVLDTRSRTECRVLEQALRDEIRGRNLLNTAMRDVVSAHRRRGALVQILDDGGLDGIQPDKLSELVDAAAARIAPLRSARIVVRTGPPDSDTAITIVASTPDETAAALGIDTDDDIDLWTTIPRTRSTLLAI
jgi:hypothetical protein